MHDLVVLHQRLVRFDSLGVGRPRGGVLAIETQTPGQGPQGLTDGDRIAQRAPHGNRLPQLFDALLHPAEQQSLDAESSPSAALGGSAMRGPVSPLRSSKASQEARVARALPVWRPRMAFLEALLMIRKIQVSKDASRRNVFTPL